ncbi:MAG: 6-bladed beta-propeller [Baekduia sp.]
MLRTFLVALTAMLLVTVTASVAAAAPKQVASTFAAAGSGNGELTAPTGGAAVRQSNGDVYVVDAGADRVQRFDAAGTYQSQFGSPGSGNGELTFAGNVAGIAIDQSDGSVYVADTGNNRIQKFNAAGVYQGQFGAAGSGDGELAGPIAVAVDQSSHDVFVADRDNNRVQRFDAAGAYEAQFGTPGAGYGELAAPSGLAVDSTGSVYVLDSGNGRVQRFTNNGTLQGVFAPSTLNLSPQAIAVDPTSDHVFVSQYAPDFSGTQILELTAAGNVVETHGTALPGPGGIARRSSTGALYATDAYGTQVLTLDDVTPTELVAAAMTGVTATTGTAHGTVNPHSGPAVTYHFETSADQASWTPTPDAGPITGGADTPVAADLSDLQPNTEYFVRLVGSQRFAAPTISNTVSFTTDAAAPDVVTGEAVVVDDRSAILGGTVNPHNASTSYWIEYGPDTSYGSRMPVATDADAGGGGSPVAMRQRITDLQAGTTYHYRLVAHNVAGTTPGADQTVTTRAAAVEEPVGRAYEMVSPVDKAGADVQLLSGGQASAAGGAIAFASTGAFGGAQANLSLSTYVARRGATAWVTTPLTPPQSNDWAVANSAAHSLSADLGKSLEVSRRALAPGAVEGAANIYLHDVASGARSYLAHAEGHAAWYDLSTADFRIVAATRDFDHVVIQASYALTSDAAPGVNNIYDLTDGQVRLVNYLPDGSVPTTGAGAPGGSNEGLNRYEDHSLISADGARIFFTVNGVLYVRENGATTRVLSVSQRTGSVGQVVPVVSSVPSRDGETVYLSVAHPAPPLTDDAPADAIESLYRVNVDNGAVSSVWPSDLPATGVMEKTFDVSADGRRVVFKVSSRNSSGVTTHRRLYTADDGVVSRIADVAPADDVGEIRLSPNGRYIAFIGRLRGVPAYDTSSPGCPPSAGESSAEACVEVYLYDATDHVLRCVSCSPAGTPPTGPPDFRGSAGFFSRARPNSLLDDGTVFFTSPDRLVAGDTNGQLDVYQWRSGVQTLISPGKDPVPASFVDASPDGTDVFFATAARLVGQDVDASIDIYDARRGGGLASQDAPKKPSPCVGDACQPQALEPSPAPALGSTTVSGAGDSPLSRTAAGKPKALTLRAISTSARRVLARTGRLQLSISGTRGLKASAKATARLGGVTTSVATASGRVPTSQTLHLTLRLSSRARQALATHRRLTVTIVVSAAGAHSRRAALTLTRKGR